MKSNLLSYLRIGALLAFFSLTPIFFVHAATCSSGSGTSGIQNPLCYPTLDGAIYAILGILIRIGTIVLVIFLIYSGFMFVYAQGEPKAIEKARSAFFWTCVGGAILLGAQALSQLIYNTLAPIIAR